MSRSVDHISVRSKGQSSQMPSLTTYPSRDSLMTYQGHNVFMAFSFSHGCNNLYKSQAKRENLSERKERKRKNHSVIESFYIFEQYKHYT